MSDFLQQPPPLERKPVGRPRKNLTITEVKNLMKVKFPKIELTTEELFLIAGFISNKGLSPYGNDFYIIPFGGKNQVIVSIEGIRKYASRMGSYGLQFKYIVGDKLTEVAPENGLRGIRAILVRDNHVFEKDVLLKEYTTGKNLWATKPLAMLLKVAEATVLRMAFNLEGMYTYEEMQDFKYSEQTQEIPQKEQYPQKMVDLSKKTEEEIEKEWENV